MNKNDLLLYAVTDRTWLGTQTLAEQVEQALRGGATMVQLREKQLTGEALLSEARAVQEVCRRYQVPFLINDDVLLARKIDADGVHIGQSDMALEQARTILGPDKILGVTAKTIEQAKAAEAGGADYLGSGAVVGSLFSFPVFGSKCAPVQHLVNVLCAVILGPVWGVAAAFIASVVRNMLGLGTLLAFPGSMCGALLSGLLYKYTRKLAAAYIGEVFGTAVIGGILAYPVAAFILNNTAAALFTFVVPFLLSTCGGTIIAVVVTLALRKAGLLQSFQEECSEPGYVQPNRA